MHFKRIINNPKMKVLLNQFLSAVSHKKLE